MQLRVALFVVAVPGLPLLVYGGLNLGDDIRRERNAAVAELVGAHAEAPRGPDGWAYMVQPKTGCRLRARANWLATEIQVVTKLNGMPDCDLRHIERAHEIRAADRAIYHVRGTPTDYVSDEPHGIECTYYAVDGWLVHIEQPIPLSDGFPKCGPPPPKETRELPAGRYQAQATPAAYYSGGSTR